MKRFHFICIISTLSTLLYSQEKGDSLVLDGWLNGLDKPSIQGTMLEDKLTLQPAVPDLKQLVPMPTLQPIADTRKVIPAWHWDGLNIPNFYTEKSPLFLGDYNVSGSIWHGHRSIVYGSGYQSHTPGVGVATSATVGYAYLLTSRLLLTGDVSMSKRTGIYIPSSSLYTSAGLEMKYFINDRMSVRAFGNYSTNVYYPQNWSWNYGAALDVKWSDHWGSELGVQRYQEANGYNKTVPIMAPYYQTESGAKFGIDLGGLIHNLLIKDQQHFGPGSGQGMMPSPKQFISMPQVRPRN